MTVLVTGGAGYIGSHMVWELVDNDEDVVVIDRLSTGFEWAVAPEAKLVKGDIGDIDLVRSVLRDHKVDSIIHFAGSIIVPDSVADPLTYYENNTCRTRALLQAAVAEGVPHFIFSSTAAVYGSGGLEPVRENAPLTPESPYGASKLMSEWMLRDAAAAHGLRYTALRYFNVAGADPRGRAGQSGVVATHLIKIAAQTVVGKRPYMQIYGTDYPTPDGTCIRDYIHVSDLASAHLLALKRLRAGGGDLIANCGYGHGFSVLEVLRGVERVHGSPLDIRLADRRPGDAPAIVANADLARAELGWVPRHDDLERIVTDAISWERRLAAKNWPIG